MRRFLLISFFISGSIAAVSQKNGTLQGTAVDTTSRQPLSSATVTLMQKKDSSLVSFTMTDMSGHFELTGLQNGEYRVLITHVNYYNSNRMVTIDNEHKNIDLGTIIMNDRSKVLGEVVVTSEVPPVTLVGDTVQYNASSFKTQPNANVEDLLKRLPGVKVDKDGTVKAQGEKVQKVLVDGKEFFGNDPKIATKNLPADAVDKVQVYDKASDQAQLTGFDDGNSEKTINLKLKKDKKKGMFGKLNAGGGSDGRYEGRFNVNSFKGARQMSVIGMGNNTNAEGFSFMDILNFTGALNQLKNGGGNININIGPNDPVAGLVGGTNRGINTTFGGGMNYNNIIGTKTDFRSNYFYSRFEPATQSTIERQYFSPANRYVQNSYADNLNNNHRLNLSADYQIDSFTSLKISPSLTLQNTRNKNQSSYSTVSDQGVRINEGSSDNLANNAGYNLNTSILLRKRFQKRGRTFSLNLLTSLNKNDGDGSLQAITNFYDRAGAPLTADSIDQRNKSQSDLGGYTARAVYTEPVFNRSLLEFSLGRSNTKNTSSKTTYDYNRNNGKFDLINSLLTNDFENTYGYTNAGLAFRKQTKKYNYSTGFSWQQSELEGKTIDVAKDSVIRKSFTNILPVARFQYFFSRFKNILINYSTSTNQPSVTQLQPIPDNSNPLYVKLGNAGLKQEFTHTVRLNASLVNPFRNRNLFAFFTLRETQNKIVNYDRINSLGVDSVTPMNVNGIYNLNGTVSWGFPVHFLKGSFEVSSNLAYDKDKQLIGDSLSRIKTNAINTLMLGPGVRLDMNPAEKVNLTLSAGINYVASAYSVQATRNSKYLNQEYSAEVDWQLTRGFYFATDFSYTINGQHAEGFNARVPLWNASIGKQILHFNRGEVKLAVKDLLDRNVAISRSTNQNYIEDSRVTSLRRFFLLSFTYSLSKTGLNPGGGIKFITR